MKVQIRNLQKIKKISRAAIEKKINKIFRLLSVSPGSVSFVFCDNECIRQLNRQYLKKNRPTDVIAFPLSQPRSRIFKGEVVVSVEEALANCQRFGTAFEEELTLYVIHGILHLCGYDDKTDSKAKKMRQRESEILREVMEKK